jgi:LPS-assembly lipoprotein
MTLPRPASTPGHTSKPSLTANPLALPATGRRRLLGLGAAAAASALFAGCGFQLRRRQALPVSSIALVGFDPRSPIEAALRREIAASGPTQVVTTPNDAQVVLRALRESREQVVVTTTSAGLVREVTLRHWFGFRVTSPDGEEVWLPDTTLLLTRDMTFNERDALGKQAEAEMLYRVMQADLVQQVMRRLAALAPPSLTLPAATPAATPAASATAR